MKKSNGKESCWTMFLQVRERAFRLLIDNIRELAPELSEAQGHQLATYAMAAADGLFIATEAGGDSVDLVTLFEMHGRSLYLTAERMIAGNKGG